MIYTYLKDSTTRRILEYLVGDVRCFGNLEDLIKGVRGEPAPVVVTGGDLGKEELIQVIKRIRGESPAARIVVITTSGQEFDQENIMKNGADAVFTKPYSPKQLVEALRT